MTEDSFEMRNFRSSWNRVNGQQEIHQGGERGKYRVSLKKWIPKGDDLTYTFTRRDDLNHVSNTSHTPTKRKVLRAVMSLFDPLGLMSFYLNHVRTLMHDIRASNVDWDEVISSRLFE